MRENEREAVSIYLCIFAKIEETKGIERTKFMRSL